jgi:hypothetical protein
VTPGRLATRAGLALALGTLLLPVLLVPVPPLLDYPNHLARLHILADIVLAGRESAIYALDRSGAWANTAVDWLGVALSAAITPAAAGSLLVGLAVLLPPLGAMLLNRAVFGGLHWWLIPFALFAWSGSLVFGLVSYQIGIGIAFLCAAADGDLRRRLPGWAVFLAHAAASAMLIAVHPFASAFLALLLGALAAGARMPVGGAVAWVRLRWGAVLRVGVACALPLAAYLLAMPATYGDAVPADALEHAVTGGAASRLQNAAMALLASLWTYRLGLDLLFVLPLFGLAAAAILAGTGFRGHAGLLAATAVLLLLAIVLPRYVLGNGATNWRLGALLGLTLMAAIRPAPGFPSRAVAALAMALTLLVLLRTAMIGHVWWASREDTRAVRAALSHVPPGSAVLPVEHTPAAEGPLRPHRSTAGRQPLYWHLATLAAGERGAFVPTLFATPGKQTVVVRPPWDAVAVHEPFLSTVRNLAVTPEDEARVAADPRFYGYRYLLGWSQRFDYVLVLNADEPDRYGSPPHLPMLDLVADEGFAQLWRVRRP